MQPEMPPPVRWLRYARQLITEDWVEDVLNLLMNLPEYSNVHIGFQTIA